MDDIIQLRLKVNKIREMKNSIIIMNPIDLENFDVQLKYKVENHEPVQFPTYQGVPIKTSDMIERGNVVVYDDISHNWI